MRDAQATRRRLLDAATSEFAEHGIAGARVDRIVAAARSNKAQLYAYYTSKDLLFDAIWAAHLDELIQDVPFEVHDLPAYATGLYDAALRDPAVARLAAWARLERVPTGHLFGDIPPADQPKLAAIAAAQRDGDLDPDIAPIDILAMLTALALTWSPVSSMITAEAAEAPSVHQRRRNALARTVRGAFSCRTPSPPP